jgi:DNA-directed RNA polymerase subunit M/transcription elongation factor TFIIS
MYPKIVFKCVRCGNVWEEPSTFWDNLQAMVEQPKTAGTKTEKATCPKCGVFENHLILSVEKPKSGGW